MRKAAWWAYTLLALAPWGAAIWLGWAADAVETGLECGQEALGEWVRRGEERRRS